MNNTLNTNEAAKLQVEIDVLSNMKSKLTNLLIRKINKPSKAYSEIQILINNISESEKEKREKLLTAKKIITSKVSEIKIDSILLENLISLRENLKLEGINSSIEFLLSYYEKDLYHSKLTSIEDAFILRSDTECFMYSKFKVIILKEVNAKVVYSTDDLILKDGINYLDLRNFRNYDDDSGVFSFSSSFTLADVYDFFSILENSE